MKILKIKIKNFRQFENLTLDFTDPNGNPLKKAWVNEHKAKKIDRLTDINTI